MGGEAPGWGVLEGGRGVEAGAASSASQSPRGSSPEQSDHNLPVPLPIQPHLPPDLSKQGKELQTWQSPRLAGSG